MIIMIPCAAWSDSGVSRGERERQGSLRDMRTKSFAPAPPQKIRAISPLKLPSLNTDLYWLPTDRGDAIFSPMRCATLRYVCMSVRLHLRVSVRFCMRVCLCVFVCMCVCVYLRVRACVSIWSRKFQTAACQRRPTQRARWSSRCWSGVRRAGDAESPLTPCGFPTKQAYAQSAQYETPRYGFAAVVPYHITSNRNVLCCITDVLLYNVIIHNVLQFRTRAKGVFRNIIICFLIICI